MPPSNRPITGADVLAVVRHELSKLKITVESPSSKKTEWDDPLDEICINGITYVRKPV